MKRALMTILLPFALAACGSAVPGYGGGATPSSQSGPATISVQGSSLGQILVDGSGKTLYLFEADTGPLSTCSGACAQAWPPLTTKALTPISFSSRATRALVASRIQVQ